MATIRELLASGQFRQQPIGELIRQLASELHDTMTGVQSLALTDVAKSADKPVKPVEPVRSAGRSAGKRQPESKPVELAPFHDHENDGNCHGVNELALADENACMDSLFKYYL